MQSTGILQPLAQLLVRIYLLIHTVLQPRRCLVTGGSELRDEAPGRFGVFTALCRFLRCAEANVTPGSDISGIAFGLTQRF